MPPKWTNQYQKAVDLTDNRRPQPPNRVLLPNAVPSGNVGAAGIVPTPRNLTFTVKHSLQKILARFVTAGDGTGVTGTFVLRPFIYTPSTRLRVGISIAVESDDQSRPDASFIVQPTWQVRGMFRNPETGRESALQSVYPSSGSANLPDAYEADSSSMLLRADVTISDTAFSIVYLPTTQRASLICCATWEPNTYINDDELKQLYDKCSLQYGDPKLITNTAT